MVWAFFLCKLELCSFKTVRSRGWNIWGIFALFLAKLRSTSAAAAADWGHPRGSQMVWRCGIWPELSFYVSWSSVASKLWILEGKLILVSWIFKWSFSFVYVCVYLIGQKCFRNNAIIRIAVFILALSTMMCIYLVDKHLGTCELVELGAFFYI